ncbi:kinase-like domain-containing protein [Syncephalastrum racemosum]|uniref:Kinase-like domain-containing protein n=1 Tax=Syncephalastrum racemosum TaxID=13706 RepID=A0A1X2HDM2_SYNRA|nr:kinase-like domain-containing protein [Syncephalastrum racemosum]
MTRSLNATYQACNDGFRYNTVHNPRRVLTKPSKPAGNDGYDNEDFDYILYVNDILGGSEGHKYIILDVLGAGTFGQVVKCKNEKTQEIVAVKVVKNKMAYFKQSMMEVAILEVLNKRHDPFDKHHILRLKDTFIHRKHLCLVFELLSVNLYELIKQNQFRGLSTNLVRVFTAQILDSLTVLNEARIIHCDLKPENILLKNLESPVIKTIDFGSACHEVQTMYTYIQSRFYRSPEVLAGLPYTSAIDMWSLGCIATELFLGLPLFPGSSEYNQISRIVEMLGVPPNYMIEMGKNAHRYFERYVDEHGQKRYRLKSMEQYSREQGKTEQPSKRYFSAKTLAELINNYPMMRKGSMSPKEIEKEKQNRLAFIDFLQGLLNLNHFERWSPQQAKQHPFITGEKFTGPFKPPYVPRKQQQQQQQQQSPSSSQSPQTQPRQGMSSLPTIHDDDAGSPGLSYSYEPVRIHHHHHPPPPTAFPSTSTTSSSAYSSSLPNYYTHNSILHPPRPPRHQDTEGFAQSSLTLPPVLEPPDALSLGYVAPSGPPPPPAPSSRKSFLSIPNVNDPNNPNTASGGGGRPRANTVGGPPPPPPPPHHHPYTQQMHSPAFQTVEPYVYPSGEYAEFQGIKVIEPSTTTSASSSRIREEDPRLMLPLSTKDAFSDQQRWDWGARVADLERDGGDWKDSPRRRMQHANHRRSNSSIHISELSASAAARSSVASNVANLHRRVRGHHVEPYSRQDIEWDGVNGIPALDSDREWRDEKSGWTIA